MWKIGGIKNKKTYGTKKCAEFCIISHWENREHRERMGKHCGNINMI